MLTIKKKILFDEYFSVLPIVDVEVCNDVRTQLPNGKMVWVNDNAIISCVGILERDRMEFVVAEHEHEPDYKAYLKKRLGALPFFYSFNAEFEFQAFRGFLSTLYDVKEIRPFSVRHGSKEAFYSILIKHKLVENEILDPYHNDGLLCVTDWKAGKYMNVVEHNTNCLLKESAILKHQSFFTGNFRVFKGWLIKKERDRFWMELGIKDKI